MEHLLGYKSNIPLQQAIFKYGIENFSFVGNVYTFL